MIVVAAVSATIGFALGFLLCTILALSNELDSPPLRQENETNLGGGGVAD